MTSAAGYRFAVARWGSEVSSVLTARFWGFFVAAFVLATGAAKKAYFTLDLPQKYSELIVGSITWTLQDKFHDYAVLYTLAFAFLAGLILIAVLATRLKTLDGPDSVDRFHDFLLVLCMPAALWFTGLLTTKNSSLYLLQVSQVLVSVGLGVFALSACRRRIFWAGRSGLLTETAHHAALFVVLSTFAVAAVGVAANRLGGPLHVQLHHWMPSTATADGMRTTAVCALVFCGLLIQSARAAETLRRDMRRAVLAAQCFLPLLLLCLIPSAWMSPASATLAPGYPLTTFASISIIAIVVSAYIEQFVRIRLARVTGSAAIQTLTVGSLIGLLLFLKMSPIGLPTLPPDDYHFGEMLVPWWSWSRMGLLPFWDYAPARGLMNYFPGLLSSALFDGSPSSMSATYPFIYAALALVAFPVLRASIGLGGTFIALLLGPFANGIGEIDFAVSIFLFAFCRGWLHWPRDRWLAGFTAVGVALIIYAPGQGALAVLSLAPFVLGALWGLYRTDRRRLGLLLAAVSGTLAAICVLTPFGKMLFGALRYGAEQSQINSIAHGINWNASFGLAGLNPWAFELMRASFMLVALWGGVLVFKASFMKDGPERTRVVVYALPVLLIGLLFVIRAAGRIDPGGSRLALASTWALSLLLPMLLFVSVRVRGVHFFIWAAIMGMVLPYAYSVSPTGYAGNFDPPDPTPMEHAPNSRSIDGGRLGSALASPAHLARIEAVRKVLDRVLDPAETYLDLSSRHAMYYYVDRKPAIESGALYNLVSENQQLRAIASIRAAHLPAVLLSAENITHDGGPASLRANLVYREVMLTRGYELATIGQQVWMIRADRVARLFPGQATSLLDLDDVAAVPVLDAFFHQQNIESVPASWGRSFESLKKELTPVLDIASDVPSSMHSIRVLGSGRYAIAGDDPYLRFDLSADKLSGRQAGILSFDFACEVPSAFPGLGMYWTTPKITEGAPTFFAFKGRQGRLLVPVDSAPSWLLAERIETLRFDLDTDTEGCETFSIRNMQLFARKAIPP